MFHCEKKVDMTNRTRKNCNFLIKTYLLGQKRQQFNYIKKQFDLRQNCGSISKLTHQNKNMQWEICNWQQNQPQTILGVADVLSNIAKYAVHVARGQSRDTKTISEGCGAKHATMQRILKTNRQHQLKISSRRGANDCNSSCCSGGHQRYRRLGTTHRESREKCLDCHLP